jgi:UDPglucose--hexose-1-phosphate uridylyltransferase
MTAKHPAPPAEHGAPHRLIWDPHTGVWLAQTPSRMSRRELTSECPFCADITSGRVPPGVNAWIRPNDFPPLTPPDGECFILIYSRDHDRTFADLTDDEAEAVVSLWQQLHRQLAGTYETVMTWETHGEAIGQTQRHPHGQAYGLAVLPDTLRRELGSARQAHDGGEGCIWCAETAREGHGQREVLAGGHWLAFVPEYARYPYQVHFHPRRHIATVSALTADEARELARHLLRVVRALNLVYQADMPYMLALHQHQDQLYHFHIELLPVGRAPGKLKLPAGAESAWDFWLNDSFPEDKAAELRAAIASEATP